MRTRKVGQLAKRTGLTVRALHHYDEIGLLTPSGRTDAGHRFYTEADVARLQQITSLRALGFPLRDIRRLLDEEPVPALEIVRRHAERMRAALEAQQRLIARLDALATELSRNGEAAVDTLLAGIEETVMFEKYYTPEQLRYLDRRRTEIGEQRIKEVEAEWPKLIAEVRAAMEAGTDPGSDSVQVLARRWDALIEEFTGGDAGIRQSLAEMYRNEDSVHGVDVAGLRPLMEYLSRARAAAERQR